MRRIPLTLLAASSLAVLSLGCDDPPLNNSSPQPGLPFTLSGVVSEYRGGPLAGVTVRAGPISARPPWPPGDPRIKTTLTDANGFYRISELTEATIIEGTKEGYYPTSRNAISGDNVVNLTMNRRLQIAAGETLRATIWGDSVLKGEDDTGAHCDSGKPCVITTVISPGPGTLTVRLSWSGLENELGVFISTGFYGGRGAYGASPLEASLEVGGYTLVVVSFENSGGRRVPFDASQTFELATTFTAR